MKKIITRKDDTVDDYHGTRVADPYRWLEDPQSAETRAWVEEENEVTFDYLKAIPFREHIRERLTELWDYPKYSAPYKKGGRYFFSKNDGLQNQSVLYMQETLESEPVPVLDPNTFSKDGTVALTGSSFSEDGLLLAYGTSSSGSDWQENRIRRIDDGTDYPDVIRWCRFASIAWRHVARGTLSGGEVIGERDNTGFFYNRWPEPGTVPEEDQSNYSRVYWHALGTQQETDVLVYERPDARELSFYPSITDDGAYLVLHVSHGTDPENRLYYREVGGDGPFVRLLDEADAMYSLVGNRGPIFYFHTDLDAPRGRVIAIDLRSPEREHWQELISQQDDVIAFVSMINLQFVVTYMHDAYHQMMIFKLDGSFSHEIPFPTLGSVVEISGEPEDTEMFVSFTSYLYPPTTYHYDFPSSALTLFRRPEINFDLDDYETTQVFYPSKDGTLIPLFLTYRKGLQLDGNNATFLYGYGGFNISLTPSFAVSRLLWLEHGGIFALANLRGGNEYGEEWHRAGMLEKKQNVFDDFIAAAEWLIANKYTSTPRLAINGGSNGGLLVGACMVQRPDLYGAVVCAVPVIDMLRYHKFTIGRYWTGEYGNAGADADQFKFMYAYSPLHNVKDGVVYPTTLILSADTDDRVVPSHAKKFAARLQEANGGTNPILLRIETRAGHGLGKPTTKVIEEQTDMYAFLFDRFGMWE